MQHQPTLDVDEMLGLDMAPDPSLFTEGNLEADTISARQIKMGSRIDAISDKLGEIKSSFIQLGEIATYRALIEHLEWLVGEMDGDLCVLTLLLNRKERRR